MASHLAERTFDLSRVRRELFSAGSRESFGSGVFGSKGSQESLDSARTKSWA